MRLKSLQKKLDKIYETDQADFRGQYLWCKVCSHCGTVPYIKVNFCKATETQRTQEFACANAYNEWLAKIKEGI